MAAFTPYEPQWVSEPGQTGSPRIVQAYPAQTALWRTGDILTPVTTGSITTPTGGAGALATVAAPSLGNNPTPFNIQSSSSTLTQGVVTVTASTAASAPAQTLWVAVTYAGSSLSSETPPSQQFVINIPAGLTANVNVTATGAPSAASDYAVYAGFFPNQFFLQHAVTALGTLTALTYPLTNSYGLNKGTTGISANIFGVADCDSDAYFAGVQGATAGGSQFTGKRSPFGATQSFSPGWTNDPFALPVVKLQAGLLEMNLKQAYYESLAGQSVGVAIDATTGYFVADTGQTACGTIQDIAFSTPQGGDTGDTYARVRVKFTASTLI